MDAGIRQQRAAATREQLIAAGLSLAERTGLAGMSVNQIVAEAGVAKGTFFHHFREKPQLTTGAPELAREACLRECSFQIRPLDNRRTDGLDSGSDATQKGALLLAGEVAINGKGTLRQ